MLSAQISNLSSSRVSHPLSELAASLSGWDSLSQSASLSEFIRSFLHFLFFGLLTELNSTLGHKKWSFYSIKSHKKENIYNFHKKNHKLGAHYYFLANFQYTNNSWIETNNHHDQRQIPHAHHQWNFRRIGKGFMVFKAQPSPRIPPNPHGGWGHSKYGFSYSSRPPWIQSYVIQTLQCTINISGNHEQTLRIVSLHICCDFLQRYPRI